MKKALTKSLLILLISSLAASCTYSKSAQVQADQPGDPLSGLIRFYRGPLNHLDAVRYGQCPMYPSDSKYALQSVKKHGMLMGWIMSMDRLMRCGRDETKLSPEVYIDGQWKTYDPLENNDFWWRDK